MTRLAPLANTPGYGKVSAFGALRVYKLRTAL
jgi:hypothetical protein